MNWTVYALQVGILILLFAVVVVAGITRSPESFVSDYPPDIREVYYRSRKVTPSRAAFTKAELLRKGIFLVLALFPLAWMAHAAGANGYWQATGVVFSYFAAIAAFDTFILDWIFFPRIRRWRLPGTEHMDRAYAQKWFHLKGVLLVSPGFLILALITGGIFVWLF